MPTQEKVTEVADLKTRFDGVKTVVLTEYRGLTVQQLSDLRKQLRAVSAEYKVVKNRLARLAIASSPLDGLGTHLKGPTGVITSREDPVAVAKALHAFARAHQALAIKAGYVEGQMLPPTELRALADLPSKEALRAQIVGMIQGGLATLVGVLMAPQRELVYILKQRGEARPRKRRRRSGAGSEQLGSERASSGAWAGDTGVRGSRVRIERNEVVAAGHGRALWRVIGARAVRPVKRNEEVRRGMGGR